MTGDASLSLPSPEGHATPWRDSDTFMSAARGVHEPGGVRIKRG